MPLPQYRVLGLMSGSSLDGLDLALCLFELDTDGEQPELHSWSIEAAQTIPYPAPWKARLRTAPHLPGEELWRLHVDLGHYFGQKSREFLDRHQQDCQLVGSHGHTVFHDPARKYTCQLGEGAALAYASRLPVINQLRAADIAAGGQGAPIAPLADAWLFPEFGAFLNLGGIANISLRCPSVPGRRHHFLGGDVSGANQILDRLAQAAGSRLPYDEGGRLAASGQLQEELLQQLRQQAYHQLPYPKSLANAWVQDELWPVVEAFPAEATDKLHTFCHFLALQVHDDLLVLARQADLPAQPVLVMVSGGGGHNQFFMELLRGLPQDSTYPFGYQLPPASIVDFKEAALVALSALWRQLHIPNALSGVTGAAYDTVNGGLHLPSFPPHE